MSTPRIFDPGPKPQPEELALIPFEVHGWYSDPVRNENSDGWAETFHARPTMPVGTLLDIASLVRVTEDGSQVYDRNVITRFFEAALANTDEVARFQVMLHDPGRVIRIEKLAEIVQWLAGDVVDRPTGPPSTS